MNPRPTCSQWFVRRLLRRVRYTRFPWSSAGTSLVGGGPSTSTVTVVTPSSSSAPPFAAGALSSALALRILYTVASIPIHVVEYAMACERRTDVGVAGHTFTNPVHSSSAGRGMRREYEWSAPRGKRKRTR